MIKKLRFGVMCVGDWLESAFAASIDRLLEIEGVELALLIIDDDPPAPSMLRMKLKRAAFEPGILWPIFQRLRIPRLSCYTARDMSAVYAGVPRIRCRVSQRGKFSQYFDPEDIERIRGYDLDFILRFAFGIIRGDILTAARYGVWSFHHDDELKFRGGPPAFWEIYGDEPTTGAILQRLADRLDAGTVLQKCHIQTRYWSYAANLDAIVCAATYMPARVCRDILAGCAHYLEAAPSESQAPIFRAPSDLQFVRFLVKTWSAWVKQQVQGILYVEDWNAGIVCEPVHAFLQPRFRPKIQWLTDANKGTFLADPFIQTVAEDRKLVLLEEFHRTSHRGVIVEMDLDATGAPRSSPREVIDNGVHMSYPYVIEHKGQLYCLPESWQSRGVSLYIFDERQRRWRAVGRLIEGFPAVDPTVVQHDGRWWLWCTNAEDEPGSKLFLWHALDIFGPWSPHLGNPVKVDVRSSRPAGRPFIFEGTLYRPAQDCSRSYGGGITINRVTRLSPAEFREEPAAYVEPWDRSYPTGIHTLVGDGSLTMVDGKRLVLAPRLVRRRLAHKMKRLAQQSGIVRHSVTQSSRG